MRAITFYSYKGGLGRTLLLSWCAHALEKRGKKVLALDLDLEAPGLHYKLKPLGDRVIEHGLVDLLAGFLAGKPPPERLMEWCLPVSGTSGNGALRILPAGSAPSPSYWRTLADLSWEQLFRSDSADGVRFFVWLLETLGSETGADYLLIDARTGVTEMGGAAMTLLADDVVAIFSASPESQHGVRAVLRAVKLSPRDSTREPPRLFPVFSRLPAAIQPEIELQLLSLAREFLNEDAAPLQATLNLPRPLPIHNEDVLLTEEWAALTSAPLRIHDEYESVLAALLGESRAPRRVEIPTAGRSMLAEAMSAAEVAVDAYRRQFYAGESASGSQLAAALLNLSDLQTRAGSLSRALRATEEAMLVYERLTRAEPERADYRRNLGVAFSRLGDSQMLLGNTMRAEAAHRTSLAVAQSLANDAHDRADYQRDLWVSYNKLGDVMQALGRHADARTLYEQGLTTVERLAETEPGSPDYQRDLSVSYNKLGDSVQALGQLEQARAYYERALELRDRLAQAEPDRADYQRDLSVSYIMLGDLMPAREQGEQSREFYERALELRERLATAEPDRADYQRDLVVALVRVGALRTRPDYIDRALSILYSLRDSGRLSPTDAGMIPATEALRDQLAKGEQPPPAGP